MRQYTLRRVDKISENDVMPKFVLTHVMAPHSDLNGGNPESMGISNLEIELHIKKIIPTSCSLQILLNTSYKNYSIQTIRQ